MKDLTTVKQGKVTTVQIVQENASQKSDRWTEYCSELYNYKTNELSCPQTQRMTTPSFAEKWRLQYKN